MGVDAIAINSASPTALFMPYATITTDNLGDYADLPPGFIVSRKYTEDWVKANILKSK